MNINWNDGNKLATPSEINEHIKKHGPIRYMPGKSVVIIDKDGDKLEINWEDGNRLGLLRLLSRELGVKDWQVKEAIDEYFYEDEEIVSGYPNIYTLGQDQ